MERIAMSQQERDWLEWLKRARSRLTPLSGMLVSMISRRTFGAGAAVVGPARVARLKIAAICTTYF
jgi:hypothetical protein